jgi:hypothetical protein
MKTRNETRNIKPIFLRSTESKKRKKEKKRGEFNLFFRKQKI